MVKNILYIFFGEDFKNESSGVQKKIIAKIKAINDCNVNCDCVSISANIKLAYNFNEHIFIIPLERANKTKFFNSYYNLLAYYNTLIHWLEINSNKYDKIIFRYPLASVGLYRLLKKYPYKIIFEHNTKEVEELASDLVKVRATIPFSLKPGYFIYKFEVGYLPLLLEKYLAPKIFKNAFMGVSVTHEIANYELNRQKTYFNTTISNGIEIKATNLRTFYPFDGSQLNLFMLKGNPALWHGVDRLIKGLEAYSGNLNITIDLIGNLNEKDLNSIKQSKCKDQIKIISSVPNDLLHQYTEKYHAGIGSLGMHRIGLKEACPLKVREYLAFGFPCIVAYQDTDLIEYKEFKPYYLQLPADESPVNFMEIEKFVVNVYKDENHPEKIRALASKYLDTKAKMSQLVSVISDRITNQ